MELIKIAFYLKIVFIFIIKRISVYNRFSTPDGRSGDRRSSNNSLRTKKTAFKKGNYEERT
jgi:hypothetical protein